MIVCLLQFFCNQDFLFDQMCSVNISETIAGEKNLTWHILCIGNWGADEREASEQYNAHRLAEGLTLRLRLRRVCRVHVCV